MEKAAYVFMQLSLGIRDSLYSTSELIEDHDLIKFKALFLVKLMLPRLSFMIVLLQAYYQLAV